MRIFTLMNTLHKSYLYKHLRKTEPANHEIHEVTTGVSLSTEMSATTESIAQINPKINLEKYKHLYQVEHFYPNE